MSLKGALSDAAKEPLTCLDFFFFSVSSCFVCWVFFSLLLFICLFGSLFIHGFISMFLHVVQELLLVLFLFLKGEGRNCIFFLSPPPTHTHTLILFCCLISPERLVQLVIEYRKEERSGEKEWALLKRKGEGKFNHCHKEAGVGGWGMASPFLRWTHKSPLMTNQKHIPSPGSPFAQST